MLPMITSEINESRIKSRALSVLELYRIWQPPVVAARLANAYGFEVNSAIFGPENAKCVAGYIDVPNRKIVVNAEDTSVRQNYTIAHELGHYLLKHHEDADFAQNYSVMMRDTCAVEPTPMELEANMFADNLLVPAAFLREYLDNYPRATDQELSRIFGVHPEVIRYRRRFV